MKKMADDDVSMDEWDENDAENDEDEGELSDGDWQLSDYRSLFSDWTFGDIEQAITHDRVNFAFDLHEFRNKAQIGHIETIMLINYIRKGVNEGRNLSVELETSLIDNQRPWKRDENMKPVLENDGFLLHDWEDIGNGQQPSSSEMHVSRSTTHSEHENKVQSLTAQNELYRNFIQILTQYIPDEVRSELLPNLGVGDADTSQILSRLDIQDREDPSAGFSGMDHARFQSRPETYVRSHRRLRKKETEIADEKYFDSYSHFYIHREMLSDEARTSAYQQALEGNPDLVQNSRVLDVGCGTGILSMFAARGGAQNVIGVDGSHNMVKFARQNCKQNGLDIESGGQISVVAGRIEDLDPPSQKCDILVSEWMGYMLLFETMLDSVLYARDRWLNPGGAILPDLASMHIAGAKESSFGLDFWNNVYGFSMSPISEAIKEGSRRKAIVKTVSENDIMTESQSISNFDITTMTLEDADFHSDFELPPNKENDGEECHAFVVWFDVEFSNRFCKRNAVKLSTSPFAKQTHWAQTLLPLAKPLKLGQGGQDCIQGRISVARSNIHRSLDISVEYKAIENGNQDLIVSSYSIAMT